jgi:inhibitor of cysteine peptidase
MSEILITPSDKGRMFEASQGDVIVIRLDENITTGYGWEISAIDGPFVELSPSVYSEAPGTLMGRGGTRTFRFKAKSPGGGQIQLRLRQPWETEDVVAERFAVNIRVR